MHEMALGAVQRYTAEENVICRSSNHNVARARLNKKCHSVHKKCDYVHQVSLNIVLSWRAFMSVAIQTDCYYAHCYYNCATWLANALGSVTSKEDIRNIEKY